MLLIEREDLDGSLFLLPIVFLGSVAERGLGFLIFLAQIHHRNLLIQEVIIAKQGLILLRLLVLLHVGLGRSLDLTLIRIPHVLVLGGELSFVILLPFISRLHFSLSHAVVEAVAGQFDTSVLEFGRILISGSFVVVNMLTDCRCVVSLLIFFK